MLTLTLVEEAELIVSLALLQKMFLIRRRKFSCIILGMNVQNAYNVNLKVNYTAC